MLLKCCQTEKKMRTAGNTQKRSAGSSMRLTNTSQTGPRIQRKVVRTLAPKRAHRGVKEEPTVDPTCDNSNDSGLGFEQHHEHNSALRLAEPDAGWPGERLGLGRVPDWTGSRQGWPTESSEAKRKRLEIKIESDDANDDFSFPDSMRQTTQLLLQSPPVERMSAPRPVKRPGLIAQRRSQATLISTQLLTKPPRGRVPGPQANRNILASHLLGLTAKGRGKVTPSPATNQMGAVSRNGKTQLSIVCQPEQQHRARYQTEGSRGAVKDRSGNSFPQVQLTGWEGAATLEVYIGSDCGKVVPHMFYQACRVSGKNSTQCQERTEEGTVVIEVQFEPTKDMVVTCDCVGILKERNVDVEHRFPDQSGSRNKKKSTRCRMVFRTILTHPDGSQETLQICSQPIACTQPPGVPEICKKSRTSSPACGGQELFILGKNFLKDTRVLLSNSDLQPPWEAYVTPDKEYLQQSHLVCVVPPYHNPQILEPVTVRLTVVSSGKSSEAHLFTYTPQPPVGTSDEELSTIAEQSGSSPQVAESSPTFQPAEVITVHKPAVTVEPTVLTPFPPVEPKKERVFPVIMWKSSVSSEDISKSMTLSSKSEEVPALLPLPRRPAVSEVKSEGNSTTGLKGMDLRTKVGSVSELAALKAKVSMATGADLSSTLPPSMATLRRFVANDNGSPLPSLSVEHFLSRLERKPDNVKNQTAVTALLTGLQVSSMFGSQPTLAPAPSVLHLVGSPAQLVFPAPASVATFHGAAPPPQVEPRDTKDGLATRRRAQMSDQVKLKDLVVLGARESMINTANPQCSPQFKSDVVPPPKSTCIAANVSSSPSHEKEDAIVQTSDMGTYTNKCSNTVHCLPVVGKDIINQSQITSPFNNFAPENESTSSLHSPPIENKDSGVMSQQEMVFENQNRVATSSCSDMFTGHLPVLAGSFPTEGGLSLSKNVEELCNVGTYHSTLPTAGGKTMVFHVPDPSRLDSYLGETPCSSSRSPPLPPKERPLFDEHVADDLSRMAKETGAMLDIHNVSPVSRYATDSPLLLGSNVPLPGDNMLVDGDISKPFNFVKPASSLPIVHVSHSDSPLLYSSMANQSSCSPPMEGSKMFDSSPMKSHVLASMPTSTECDRNSLSLARVVDYNPSVGAHGHGAVSPSLGDLHPLHCISVDPGLTQTMKMDDILANSQVQPPTLHDLIHLPATTSSSTSPVAIENMILTPPPMSGEQNVAINITPLGMPSLIHHPSACVDTTSISNSNCTPTIAMKNLILSNGDLGSDNTIPRSCGSSTRLKDMLLSSVAPRATRMAMKDMMLRVDVSSTMDDHLMSQPGAITPETVRLDALVNSTLDRHIDSVQAPPPTPLCSTLEATSSSPATLLDNMYPLPALNHDTCNLPGGLLQQVTCAPSSIQYNPSTDASSSMEFKSEPTAVGFSPNRPNVEFAMLATNTQFAVVSNRCFATTSSNPCPQGSDLTKPSECIIQKDGNCARKVEGPDGAAVRERREEGMFPQELTQMSDHDLISYINPSCFDQV